MRWWNQYCVDIIAIQFDEAEMTGPHCRAIHPVMCYSVCCLMLQKDHTHKRKWIISFSWLSHNPYLFVHNLKIHSIIILLSYVNDISAIFLRYHLQVKPESERFPLSNPAVNIDHHEIQMKRKETHSVTGTKAHGKQTDKKPVQQCIAQQSCCNAF